MNLKDKIVLVIDNGLFTEQASRLARDFGKVYYFCPWASAFPKSNLALIGEGFDGLERILNFWDYVEEADIIFCPDMYSSDLVEYLKSKGYKVAGAGAAEILELNRWFGRQVQERVGLPTQKTVRVKSLGELRELLKETENKFVKFNTFRGEIETFKHIDYESSLPLLDHLAYELGPKQDKVEFIVEDEVEGVEPGGDMIVFGDHYLSPTMYGYEFKGMGYLGRVCSYEETPKPVKLVHDKLLPVFQHYNTHFFISLEMRIDKNATPYLIDYTIRMAAPVVSAVQVELIENFSEVVWGLATGEEIQPKISYKYAGGVVLESEWAQDHWTKVNFPPEIRRWIKLRMAAKFGDDYYTVPGFPSLCSVIALGNSIEEVIEQVKKRTQEVQAYLIQRNLSGMDEINEAIEEGRKLGVDF